MFSAANGENACLKMEDFMSVWPILHIPYLAFSNPKNINFRQSAARKKSLTPYLGRINDGAEIFDAKHAEIRDGEGAALKLVGLQFAISGFGRERGHFRIDGR